MVNRVYYFLKEKVLTFYDLVVMTSGYSNVHPGAKKSRLISLSSTTILKTNLSYRSCTGPCVLMIFNFQFVPMLTRLKFACSQLNFEFST